MTKPNRIMDKDSEKGFLGFYEFYIRFFYMRSSF